MQTGLMAALGKVKITPEERTPLQGYNPETHIADPQTDLLDDLYARVLLLDDGEHRYVLVSVDCCMTNEEPVKVADPQGRQRQYREFIPSFPVGTRKKWAQAAGTDSSGVSVHATHTHTAPAHYSEKYTVRIEKLIRELPDKLKPVKISVAEGQSGISAFRRPTLRADLSVPVNQALKILVVETEEGNPIGAVVNYAVHPTALRNPANRLSGDIVGLAVSHVEQQFHDGFIALFMQGFSGDICPLYGDNGPKEDTYPDVVKGSLAFSSSILDTMKSKTEVPVTSVRALTKTVSFPTKEHFYKPSMEVTLFGLSLGDVLILAISGEVFNEYIAKMEAVSPFRYSFLSGVANGYSGYLPTKEAFHDGLGGYEMNTTPYTDEVEDILMSETESLMRLLHISGK